MSNGRPRLLLVDDEPGAIMLARIALEESGLQVELSTSNGFRESLAYLEAAAQARAQRPDLVLLDLNLKDGSGHDLLAYIKSEPKLAAVPVIILSTSSYPKDINRATALGAAGYLVKPSAFDELVAIMGSLRRFLPSHPETV